MRHLSRPIGRNKEFLHAFAEIVRVGAGLGAQDAAVTPEDANDLISRETGRVSLGQPLPRRALRRRGEGCRRGQGTVRWLPLFALASSSVMTADAQPGSSGQTAEKLPLSGSRSIMTRKPMFRG